MHLLPLIILVRPQEFIFKVTSDKQNKRFLKKKLTLHKQTYHPTKFLSGNGPFNSRNPI